MCAKNSKHLIGKTIEINSRHTLYLSDDIPACHHYSIISVVPHVESMTITK